MPDKKPEKVEKPSDALTPPGTGQIGVADKQPGAGQDNVVPPVPAKTIEVPLEDWQKIISELNTLKQGQEVLFGAADEVKVAAFLDKKRIPGSKFVRLSTYNLKGEERIVIGWKSTKDLVYQEPSTGIWREDQRIEMFFYGTADRLEVQYVDFVRRTSKVQAEVVETRSDERGITYRVKLEDGRTLDIAETFVN